MLLRSATYIEWKESAYPLSARMDVNWKTCKVSAAKHSEVGWVGTTQQCPGLPSTYTPTFRVKA